MTRQPTADDFRVNKTQPKVRKTKPKMVSNNAEVLPPLAKIIHYDRNGRLCDMKDAVAFSMTVDGKKNVTYKILMSSGTPVDISQTRLPKNRRLESVSEEVFTLYMQYLLRRQLHDYEKTVRAQTKAI
jgi:hypothetical protein